MIQQAYNFTVEFGFPAVAQRGIEMRTRARLLATFHHTHARSRAVPLLFRDSLTVTRLV